MAEPHPVVVITGASSGIGRATAHVFAVRGANLVLAARRWAALEEVRCECERKGGRALVVQTDVGEEGQVLALRDAALAEHGRIDVWVSNAGVSLFGRVEDSPAEEVERLIRTNLLAAFHCARAVVPHFRQRGRGTLILVSSVVSYVGQPFTSAYCASKFALRALAECLRQELVDAPCIHVCTLLPASIDTEIFQNAANHTGRAIRPLDPVYPPERVGRDVAWLAEHPRRELISGPAGYGPVLGKRIAPGFTEQAMGRQVRRGHFQSADAGPSSGNLHAPRDRLGAVSGGWRQRRSDGWKTGRRPPLRRTALGLLAISALAGFSLAKSLLGEARRGDG